MGIHELLAVSLICLVVGFVVFVAVLMFLEARYHYTAARWRNQRKAQWNTYHKLSSQVHNRNIAKIHRFQCIYGTVPVFNEYDRKRIWLDIAVGD